MQYPFTFRQYVTTQFCLFRNIKQAKLVGCHYIALSLKSLITGKSTTGTVRVTATSTARRTHRMSVSRGSTLLQVCRSSASVFTERDQYILRLTVISRLCLNYTNKYTTGSFICKSLIIWKQLWQRNYGTVAEKNTSLACNQIASVIPHLQHQTSFFI